MKRILMTVAIAAVLASGVSFAVARWFGIRNRPDTVLMNDDAWLKRQLSLNDDQISKVEKIGSEFRAKMATGCEAHCAARFELTKELTKAEVAPEKARFYVERMCAAQVESEQLTLAHILKVRELLTPPTAGAICHAH